MPKQTLKLVFPQHLIQQPVIYNLAEMFPVVTNIVRANVEADRGWVMLELDGDGEEIDLAFVWLTAKGVNVERTDASLSV